MYCRSCRYPLSDVRGTCCPECGRRFDPADPRTFARRQWRLSIDHLVRSILVLTALGSLTLLSLSIWPGVLADLVFWAVLSSILWLPISLIAFIFLAVFLYRRHRQGGLLPIPKWQVAAVPTVVVLTLALLFFYVPRRLAFLLSRSAFERMAQSAPPPGTTPVNAWLGTYWVDEYAGDASGTVFFRVHSGSAGLGPDVMSYGFVRQPSQQSTPFGAAGYRVFHIVDDWYWFRVSDDWF